MAPCLVARALGDSSNVGTHQHEENNVDQTVTPTCGRGANQHADIDRQAREREAESLWASSRTTIRGPLRA